MIALERVFMGKKGIDDSTGNKITCTSYEPHHIGFSPFKVHVERLFYSNSRIFFLML